MAFEVRRTGVATALHVRLRRGDRVKAEPDALVTMSQHVHLGAALDNGLFTGLMRALFGGESLFVQTVQAGADGCDATFCPSAIGDVETIEVSPDSSILLQKGAFLAAHETVDLQTATQLSAKKAFFSGVGLFVLRASGHGTLAVNAVGGILRHDLRAGEVRAVDNGHLVAWDAAMRYDVRMAAQQRGLVASMVSSAVSGEGLMCFFEGPGRLWLQTHKPPPEAKGSRGGVKQRGNQCVTIVIIVVFVLVFATVVGGIAAFGLAGGSSDSHRSGSGSRAGARRSATSARQPRVEPRAEGYRERGSYNREDLRSEL